MDPSWQPDPTGRHQYRWWDGMAWTDVVANHGIESRDPYPSTAGQQSPGAAGGPRRIVVSTDPETMRRAQVDPTPMAGIPVSRDPTVSSPTVRTVSIGANGTGQNPGRPGDATSSLYATPPPPSRRHIGRIAAALLVALGVIFGALYLFVFRNLGGSEENPTGVSTGFIAEGNGFYFQDIRLLRGEVIRFRVESPSNRDLITYLLMPEDLAGPYASQFVSDAGVISDITDPQDVLDTYTDASELFDEGDVREAMRGYVQIKPVDRCCRGVPDAGSFVAFADGVYRIAVIEANAKESTVRLILESLGRLLVTTSDLRDSFNTDSFYSDPVFFRNTDAYDPAG